MALVRNFAGKMQPEPRPKGKKVLGMTTSAGAYPIALYHTGKDKFTVTYGLSLATGLNYQAAALELGQSIMHSLMCDGQLEGDQ